MAKSILYSAMYATPYWDMLAYNRLADVVFKFDDYSGPHAHSHIWRLFMDPKRRVSPIDEKGRAGNARAG